jgi:hypothetical protein
VAVRTAPASSRGHCCLRRKFRNGAGACVRYTETLPSDGRGGGGRRRRWSHGRQNPVRLLGLGCRGGGGVVGVMDNRANFEILGALPKTYTEVYSPSHIYIYIHIYIYNYMSMCVYVVLYNYIIKINKYFSGPSQKLIRKFIQPLIYRIICLCAYILSYINILLKQINI